MASPIVQKVDMNLKTTWNTLNHRDVWTRAGKTAVQAFIPAFLLGLANVQHIFVQSGLNDAEKALYSLALAAAAAAGSAVWNYYKQLTTPHIAPPVL